MCGGCRRERVPAVLFPGFLQREEVGPGGIWELLQEGRGGHRYRASELDPDWLPASEHGGWAWGEVGGILKKASLPLSLLHLTW